MSPAITSSANVWVASLAARRPSLTATFMISASPKGVPLRRSGRKIGEPQAAELPARGGRKKVAIARPGMPGGSGERRAAQHHLVHHEFAVVLAERAGHRAVAGIGRIGATRPLPDDAEGVLEFPG